VRNLGGVKGYVGLGELNYGSDRLYRVIGSSISSYFILKTAKRILDSRDEKDRTSRQMLTSLMLAFKNSHLKELKNPVGAVI
jgi:hypothetical protein